MGSVRTLGLGRDANVSTELECLSHLKELKADGNAITDLSGIAAIEGLVSLSVANNRIGSLDLGRTKW